MAVRLKRPRGFIVLGERIGIGWPVIGAILLLALAFGQAAEERAEIRERKELRARIAATVDALEECMDVATTCDDVLAKCIGALGGEATCSCWFDDDGAAP